MGLLDDVQSTINRGVAATGRTARVVKLKSQMTDSLKRRQNLAAQLGASLYDATKDNDEFRAGREGLYDGIAAIGSGGMYALAAARALLENTELSAKEIAEKALHVASSICVYTNDHIIVEEA